MDRASRSSFSVALALLGVLSLGAAAASGCRQHDDSGVDPGPIEPVAEIGRQISAHRPLLVVGLDGADWQLLDRLVDEGVMPNLAGLRDRAVWGTLLSEEPMLSPLLWTTMATGVSPLRHRILDFTRRNPDSGDEELITSSERQRPALWNMASAGGLEVAVYGVWASWPAEPVRGTLVSDRLYSFLYGAEAPPPRVAYPEVAENRALDALEEAKRSVDLTVMRRFLPWLDRRRYEAALEVERSTDDLVASLRRIVVQTEVYTRLALARLRRGPPDLTLLYVEGTDAVGHVFAPYLAPRRSGIERDEVERYSEVPRRYYAYVDDLLGELVDAVGEANILVVSDHGFRWRARPTLAGSDRAATAALWHRREGIYLLAGPRIVPRRLDEPAGGIRQVTATALALLGMPPGDDLAGPALPGAKPDRGRQSGEPVRYAEYFEPVAEPDPGAAGAASDLEQLRALGYIGASDSGDGASEVTGTMTAAAYDNQGRLLQEAGRLDSAEASFRRALELVPERPESLVNLAILLTERGETAQAIALLERAIAADPGSIQTRMNLARALSLAGRWSEAIEQYEIALERHPGDRRLRTYRAQALLEAGSAASAAEAFGELVREEPERAVLRVREAQALAMAGKMSAARSRLEAGRERLPQSGEIAHALARLLLTDPDPQRRDPARALELARGVFAARPTLEHGETLAVALAANGDRQRAHELAERLLEEARDSQVEPDVQSRLERLRDETG